MKAFCKMTNVICESSNQSWAVFHECRLRAINRNITTLTAEATLLQPLATFDTRMQLKTKAFGYNPAIFDYTVNGCTFMERQQHRTFKIYYQLMRKFSTINHTCPFEVSELNGISYHLWNHLSLPGKTNGKGLLLRSKQFHFTPT